MSTISPSRQMPFQPAVYLSWVVPANIQLNQVVTSNLTPPFRFNNSARRYIDGRGRFVSWGAVETFMNDVIKNSADHVDLLCQKLATGQISLADWQLLMVTEIRNTHLVATALAKGGWHSLRAVDYGRVGGRLAFEYRKLRDFAMQIEAGLALDGAFLRRAQMYVKHSRLLYHWTSQQGMAARGWTHERSLLGIADSCQMCVAEAQKEWQAIGRMVPIGLRTCLSNCYCSAAYMNARTGAIQYA